MNMNRTKLYIFAALILIMAVLAVSCGGNAEQNNVDEAASGGGENNNNEQNTSAVPSENIYEQFPKTDFGGRDFTMLIFDYMQEEHNSESEIGDVFSDAVYNRNKKIEDDYNINFKFRITSYSDATNDLRKSVLAGDKSYDLGAIHAVAGAAVVGDNLYTDWHTASVISENLGNPWWNKSVEKDMSIAKKSFFIAGDIGYIFTAHTHVLLFNKQLFSEAGIDYPYETVKNGAWTYDAFESIIKNCNRDLNGDGELKIEDDSFGCATMSPFGDVMYFYSLGGKILEKDANDLPVLVLNSERNAAVIETGYRWWIENKCPVIPYTQNDDYTKELTHIAFNDDRAYFLATNLKNLRVFRNMDSEYGIVPFPKLDQSQENYISTVDGAATMLVLPRGSDADVSGTIAEAMARESSLTVIPAYYDSTLQIKFTRDEETKDMLKIIKDTAYFDIGYIYNFGGSGFVSQTLLNEKSTNLASYYEKNAGAIQKAIDKLVEYCQKMD